MKGIILAGGSGTRLYPLTMVVSKQLMPIYDKPMIYYPLSTLMLAGIKEILIITTPQDVSQFKALLGDGTQLGLSIFYETQPSPDGLAQALTIGEKFLNGSPCCLILGDNIFYGDGFPSYLRTARADIEINGGAKIFGYSVSDPERYGVIEFDKQQNVISLEEKPEKPKSQYAAVGLYFYDRHAVNFAKSLKPSHRGELEITDLNKCYLKEKKLKVELLGRGMAWLDTGTHESLIEASTFIHTLEKRQGIKIGSPEEIAFRMGFIDREELHTLAKSLGKSGYGSYLLRVASETEL